jgi:prepilin-type N-terminal cleavage/methylation domain-containing protein
MNRPITLHSRRRGLSLIELLVVVAIMLIIISLVCVTVGKVWRLIESWKR